MKWFQLLLDENNCFDVDQEEKTKILIFAAILFDQLWLWRNKIRLGATIPNWNLVAAQMRRLLFQHWNAAQSRSFRRIGITLDCWSLPPLGELKMNFDASLIDHSATSAVVLRDHHGQVRGAWINHFNSSNSFCAELEAAIQAFSIAESLNITRLWLEGDALQVILTLQGLDQYRDWRALDNINRGKTFLRFHSFWSVKFVYRNCNLCVHKLAAWARSSSLNGCLEITTIPPEVLCDRGGTFVPLDEDPDCND